MNQFQRFVGVTVTSADCALSQSRVVQVRTGNRFVLVCSHVVTRGMLLAIVLIDQGKASFSKKTKVEGLHALLHCLLPVTHLFTLLV